MSQPASAFHPGTQGTQRLGDPPGNRLAHELVFFTLTLDLVGEAGNFSLKLSQDTTQLVNMSVPLKNGLFKLEDIVMTGAELARLPAVVPVQEHVVAQLGE